MVRATRSGDAPARSARPGPDRGAPRPTPRRAGSAAVVAALAALVVGCGSGSSVAPAPLSAASVVLAQLPAGSVLAARPSDESTQPRRLQTQVTDEVGALEGRRSEVDDALRQLQEDTGLQLFVVFVASFGGTPAPDWLDETASLSGLGDRDGLLVVAVDDREYAYNVDPDLVPPARADEVAATAIEPALSANDWAGAVLGAASGYRAAGASEPVNTRPRDSGRSSAGVALLVVVVLVLGGAAVWALLYAWGRSREKATRLAADPQDAFPGVSTEQLSTRANTLLLQVDDALRTSERELGLARAEYGEEATAPFAKAVDQAKAGVAEAFRLRMELEDLPGATHGGPKRAEEGDEVGTRRRLAEIIRHAEAADATLDEQAEAFRELRALESTLEQTIPALTSRRAQLAARLPEVGAELDRLRAEFAGPTLAAVAGNAEEAAQRLRFVTATLAQAGQDAASGRRSRAALSVRAADQALDSSGELFAAVDRAAADLRAAKAAIPALLTEVESEIETARTARPSTEELTAAVSAGERAVSTVRAAQAEPTSDPLAQLRRLREADGTLDQALEKHRDAKQRADRAAAQLESALAAARAEISAADDFINTRRGAVGTRARTLLAEAQRLLAEAEAHASADPVAALDAARRADHTAEQAVRAAQSDVDSWSGLAGYGRSAGVDGLLGAILGGILVGGARGGWGGHGGGWSGGWSGGTRGGRGGGSWGGGGFGGHSPGGFGGSRGGGSFGGGRGGFGGSRGGGRF